MEEKKVIKQIWKWVVFIIDLLDMDDKGSAIERALSPDGKATKGTVYMTEQLEPLLKRNKAK